jgi:hypothetical protein
MEEGTPGDNDGVEDLGLADPGDPAVAFMRKSILSSLIGDPFKVPQTHRKKPKKREETGLGK